MKKDHSKKWHSNQIYWIQKTKTLELVVASPFTYPHYNVLIHPWNVAKQCH